MRIKDIVIGEVYAVGAPARDKTYPEGQARAEALEIIERDRFGTMRKMVRMKFFQDRTGGTFKYDGDVEAFDIRRTWAEHQHVIATVRGDRNAELRAHRAREARALEFSSALADAGFRPEAVSVRDDGAVVFRLAEEGAAKLVALARAAEKAVAR